MFECHHALLGIVMKGLYLYYLGLCRVSIKSELIRRKEVTCQIPEFSFSQNYSVLKGFFFFPNYALLSRHIMKRNRKQIVSFIRSVHPKTTGTF